MLTANGNVGEVPSKAGVSSLVSHPKGAGESDEKSVMASNLHIVSGRFYFREAISTILLLRTLELAAMV